LAQDPERSVKKACKIASNVGQKVHKMRHFAAFAALFLAR
jgi:hypothetical protein